MTTPPWVEIETMVCCVCSFRWAYDEVVECDHVIISPWGDEHPCYACETCHQEREEKRGDI